MKKIEVKTSSRNYPVYIGNNIFSSINTLIEKHNLYSNIFIVVDKNVNKHYKSQIRLFASSFTGKTNVFVYEALESTKNFEAMMQMYSGLIDANYGRDTLIIAFGGGITGDVVGFVASTFGRGTQFVQIPTTLLSCVDSSVGGKTGINYGETKNLIGSFFQPNFVLVDANFWKTLPKEEIICGIGEIVKYAFLIDNDFYNYVEENITGLIEKNKSVTEIVIEKCVQFKAGVVEADEKETGLRKILNLGHTFAHAIEVEQKHSIKHGQAVIIGIVSALYLSHSLGFITEKELEKYLVLPMKLQKYIHLDSANIENIYTIMLRDKKNLKGKIKFVLLNGPGKILIDVEADKNKVITALENGISLFI